MTSKAIVTQTSVGVTMHSVESVQAVLNEFPALTREKLIKLYSKFDDFDTKKESKITAADLQEILKRDEVFTSPKQIARIIKEATNGTSSSELRFKDFVTVMLQQDNEDSSKKLTRGGSFKLYHESASSVISKFESNSASKENLDTKQPESRNSVGTVAAAKAALFQKGFVPTSIAG